jgi:hypothetical protein
MLLKNPGGDDAGVHAVEAAGGIILCITIAIKDILEIGSEIKIPGHRQILDQKEI